MEEALKYMEDHSYMELDDENEDALYYTTRENGDVGEEEYGEEDVIHAKVIAKGLHLLGYSTEIDTVDEWVNLTITK